MSKILRIQFKTFFSNKSQVLYILLCCIMIPCAFSIVARDLAQTLVIVVPILCMIQMAPGIFVSDKENRIFETLLTLPLKFADIFMGKVLCCFITTTVMLYLAYSISIAINILIIHTEENYSLNICSIIAIGILPLHMLINQSVKTALLSLKSNDSKACALDVTLIAFIYTLPCFIEVACVNQPVSAWIVVAVLYLIIETIISLILYKKFSVYKDKCTLNNLFIV